VLVRRRLGNSGCDLWRWTVRPGTASRSDIVIRHAAYFQPEDVTSVRPPPGRCVLHGRVQCRSDQDLIARFVGPGSPSARTPTYRDCRCRLTTGWLRDRSVVKRPPSLLGSINGRVERRPGNDIVPASTQHGALRRPVLAGLPHVSCGATGFRSDGCRSSTDRPGCRDGPVIPCAMAGGIIPQGLREEKLYYIGLSAPRRSADPGLTASRPKLAERMIRLLSKAGPGGAGIAAYFARLQEADDPLRHPAGTSATRRRSPDTERAARRVRRPGLQAGRVRRQATPHLVIHRLLIGAVSRHCAGKGPLDRL
jgi:hypothetical protein